MDWTNSPVARAGATEVLCACWRQAFEPLGFTRKVPCPMAVRADAALQAQEVRLGQRVVFVDEMRVGRIGQVRQRWTARGVRLCPRVARSYKWR